MPDQFGIQMAPSNTSKPLVMGSIGNVTVVIAAAVYNATRGMSHSISPRESGATNTTTHAELV